MKRYIKLVEAIIAVVILCLIALAIYEFMRLSDIEDAAEEYEHSCAEEEVHPPPQSQSKWASPTDETGTDLSVPY